MIAGHVHAYDRSYPVNNYTVDPCGTTHVLIGDGGKSGGVRLQSLGLPPAMDLLTAGHCCGTRNGAMAPTLAGSHSHVCSIAQFECELTPGCPQVSTGYVDDSAACLAANPGDGHKSYGNYPTLLNAPLSGAHQCVAPVPYCTPNVQAAWSAYRCARRGPQPPHPPLPASGGGAGN